MAYSTKSEELATLLAKLVISVYGKAPRVKLRRYKDGHAVYWIRVWSKALHDEYVKIFNTASKKSKTAKPPAVIWDDPEAELCFLIGVFDAESWSYNWRGLPRISMELYNKDMMFYLKGLLDRSGIRAHISSCRDGAYRLDMTGSAASKFIEKYNNLKEKLLGSVNH